VAVNDQATQAFGIRGRHKTRSKKQLEELPRGWLELSGYCRRIALLPLSLLIEKHGGGWGVSCRECGGRPSVMARRGKSGSSD
jgi:hypothetical protein